MKSTIVLVLLAGVAHAADPCGGVKLEAATVRVGKPLTEAWVKTPEGKACLTEVVKEIDRNRLVRAVTVAAVVSDADRASGKGLNTAKAIKVHGMPRGSNPTPKPAEAWWALTRGAAEALGLQEQIGTIEPGKEADCLVVRPEGWIADLPPDQQASALLYTLRPEQIEHVFIAGRRVGPGK